MERSRREEGYRNFWKYRAGPSKTSLDLEALHILGDLVPAI